MSNKAELFGDIAFKVHLISPKKSIFKEIPKLGLAIPGFLQYRNEMVDAQLVIKAIIYAFDRNSDLPNVYPDILERREKACEYAGLEAKDIDWASPIILNLALAYLYYQNNMLFVLLKSCENQFFMIQRTLTNIELDARDSKARAETLGKMKDLTENAEYYLKKIASLNQDIFGENKDVATMEAKKRDSDFQESIAEEIAKLAQ